MADLLVERRGHVTVLTLNRPEKHNAISPSMKQYLREAFAQFTDDDDQYVAIVTGAGDKAFCAGADLTDIATADANGTKDIGVTSLDPYGVGASHKPTIAAINGLAVGGGLELCLGCDIRVADERAWFGAFEVKRGLMAGVAVNLLPRLMPLGDALNLLFAGDRLPAADAHRLGLVQRVTATGASLDVAMGIAEMICANSQTAVQASKMVATAWRNVAADVIFERYREVNEQLMRCDDVVEGPRAFAERREPKFTNRWPTGDRP